MIGHYPIAPFLNGESENTALLEMVVPYVGAISIIGHHPARKEMYIHEVLPASEHPRP